MKLFIFLLIIACLVESAFLPINIVLILLISRSLNIDEDANLYMGFFSGIFLGLLSSFNLGFYALAFLISVQIIRISKKMPISANTLTVVPLSFILILLLSLAQEFFFQETFTLSSVIIQSLLALPIFIMVKFWEERFVVAPPLKLKI